MGREHDDRVREREVAGLVRHGQRGMERHRAKKRHLHLKGEDDSLMDLARRAKCAADAGVTDPLTAFMAVFHPDVDMTTPEMREARAESRRNQ